MFWPETTYTREARKSMRKWDCRWSSLAISNLTVDLYIKKNYPLIVLEEHEEWRRVEDLEKNIGWIHKSLISGIRTGIVLSNDSKNIKLFNTLGGSVIGEIGMGNIIFLEKCKIDWCLISSGNFKGWMDKKYIWGVKEKEIIKISIFQRFEDLYWKSLNYLNKIH